MKHSRKNKTKKSSKKRYSKKSKGGSLTLHNRLKDVYEKLSFQLPNIILTSTSSAGKTTIATQLDKSYSYKQIAYDDLRINEKINEVAIQTVSDNKNFVIDTIKPNLDEVHSTIVNEPNVYKVLIYTDIEDLGRNIENRYKKGLEALKNIKEKLGIYARGIFVFDQFLSFYKKSSNNSIDSITKEKLKEVLTNKWKYFREFLKCEMPDSIDCFNSNKVVLEGSLEGVDFISKEDFIKKYVEHFFKKLEVTDETCNIEPRHNYDLVIKTKNKDQYKLTDEILEKILLLKLQEKHNL